MPNKHFIENSPTISNGIGITTVKWDWTIKILKKAKQKKKKNTKSWAQETEGNLGSVWEEEKKKIKNWNK